MRREKGPPRSVPLGVLSAGLVVEADPSTPFPLPPWAHLCLEFQGKRLGAGEAAQRGCPAGPHQKGVGGRRVSLSDFAGESWRRAQ